MKTRKETPATIANLFSVLSSSLAQSGIHKNDPPDDQTLIWIAAKHPQQTRKAMIAKAYIG